MGLFKLRSLFIAAAVAGSALAGAEARAGSAQGGWTEIPTRISGVTMRYRSLGCNQDICSIEVDTNIPGGANYRESINCNKQQIQTVMNGKAGPWLRVDRGSVDEVKFQKICSKH